MDPCPVRELAQQDKKKNHRIRHRAESVKPITTSSGGNSKKHGQRLKNAKSREELKAPDKGYSDLLQARNENPSSTKGIQKKQFFY
jgi:hypothetical protein